MSLTEEIEILLNQYSEQLKKLQGEPTIASPPVIDLLERALDQLKGHSMESAPKDGTEILGYREDCGWLLIRWCCIDDFLTESELEKYDEETQFQQDWFCADFIGGERLESDLVPTKWLPLPP